MPSQLKGDRRGLDIDTEEKTYTHAGESYVKAGRDWSAVATSQGMAATTVNWKRQGTDSPLEFLERVYPC